MAITSITIENFKGIGDAVTIPIRPITLLFGKNSAGKSTVLQALRYLRGICNGLNQKLEASHDHDIYKILKAVHTVCDHSYDLKYREVLNSVQTDKLEKISIADLSNIDSHPSEVLKSIQKLIEDADLLESKDEEKFQAEGEAFERGEIYPGRFTNLGSFPSLVHRHEFNRKIRIRLEFDIKSKQAKFLNRILSLAIIPEDIVNLQSAGIEIVTGWDEKQRVIYLDSYKYALNGAEWICITPANKPMSEEADVRRPIDLTIYSHPITQAIKLGLSKSELLTEYLSWLLGTDNGASLNKNALMNLRPGLEENVLKWLVEDVIKEVYGIVIEELPDIRHLGPVRDVLPRHHNSPLSMSNSTVSRWAMGLEAWDALAQNPQLVEKTNRYMIDVLKLGYSIRLFEDSEHRIQLYDETHKIYLHPLDVGFGISQVIPVLVGALDDSQSSGVFAIEQPELHIHPALQVALGDVFIDGIKNSNRTMLIETHSEHLLLRIMRRMRETFEDRIEENRFPVTPDDIAVLFVEWHDSQTIIREMPVNERGELVKAWPGGFFEEDIEEVFA